MDRVELQNNLYAFIRPNFPEIKIEIEDTQDNGRCIYFTDAKFKDLYQKQRYHYLAHLIPSNFYDEYLSTTKWFELTPNEDLSTLNYLDQEVIQEIREPILSILREKVHFPSLLDSQFVSGSVKCFGDFRHSKTILNRLTFSEKEQFDIFHVLMNEGAFCDCEILYNVFKDSEYSKHYWNQRHK